MKKLLYLNQHFTLLSNRLFINTYSELSLREKALSSIAEQLLHLIRYILCCKINSFINIQTFRRVRHLYLASRKSCCIYVRSYCINYPVFSSRAIALSSIVDNLGYFSQFSFNPCDVFVWTLSSILCSCIGTCFARTLTSCRHCSGLRMRCQRGQCSHRLFGSEMCTAGCRCCTTTMIRCRSLRQMRTVTTEESGPRRAHFNHTEESCPKGAHLNGIDESQKGAL